MRTFSGAVLGACLIAFAGPASAQDDNAKKIVGAWEVAKVTGDLPAGSVVDFQKDGKIAIVVKEGDKDMKLDGTYKVEKDKVNVTITVMGQKHEESLTIKKLTDEALELEDKDKKVETFKKKK